MGYYYIIDYDIISIQIVDVLHCMLGASYVYKTGWLLLCIAMYVVYAKRYILQIG
ncbi:hypothetical protein oki184_33120 [Helicobacter pylori]